MNIRRNKTKSRHLLKKIYFKPSLTTTKKNALSLKYKISRPLLFFSRFNFLKFCEFWNLPVYPDGTNFNIYLLRNRLRLELLPYLKFFFNRNLFNKINQIQNILDFENQYFQLLLQKIFLIFFQENLFIFKDKNLFKFIKLKIKKNYFLNFLNKPRLLKASESLRKPQKASESLFGNTNLETQNTLFEFNFENNKKKSPDFGSNRIGVNTIRKSYKIVYKSLKIKNLFKRVNSQVHQVIQFNCKKPLFFNKRFSTVYINDYFAAKIFNDLFYTLPYNRHFSFKCLALKQFNQQCFKSSKIKYNFLFFPKFLQYRIFYNFYYNLRKKISFYEVRCFFKKLNIKKK